jgi:hypothetical protein
MPKVIFDEYEFATNVIKHNVVQQLTVGENYGLYLFIHETMSGLLN